MKKIFYIIISTILFSFSTFSQEKTYSVEISIYGFQTGLFGAWVYNETKLNNEFTLKTEIGLDAGYSYSDFDSPKSQYILIPSLSLEPRWYYNFSKRDKKGKSLSNNAANYLSLKTTYNPDLFVIANIINPDLTSIFRIIPSWGIRRDLGSNFDFDLRLGFGYVFASNNTATANGFAPDFSVRFGYIF
ncbi:MULTISPECIES: hypothetical protein [unclassified Polaribacter]|uniref:hypothetical protein n=1 Tax=unclassified Polaribacter TaxID=196858 RepID=UPI0011BEDC11|nr:MULTISPECIES: hypothetical protein [unclassified Polaribacter]TXD52424.1 hypothetical protein ES043_08500 [Polaribacter sp. IC063]TXD61061.1 hypothetical protein ES044_05770 [Polaribacter sp. IC066]